jgi:hypothetical protein
MRFWVKVILPALWISQSEGMDFQEMYIDAKSQSSKSGQNFSKLDIFGGNDLYEIDFSKCELARARLAELPEHPYKELINDFNLITSKMLRPNIDKEAIFLKCVINLGYQERKEGVSLKLYECKTVASVIDIMTNHFKEHFEADWEEKAKDFQEGIDRVWHMLTDYIAQYEDYRKTYGPIKTWKIKNYINRLLNIDDLPLSITQQALYETVYDMLIKTGFVRSAIHTTRHFKYNPGVMVRAYMNTYKDVDRLILGCGHHLSGQVSDYLGIEREAFCGMCDLTHFHHGDLTIALYTSDLPDVVANMHDDRIWEVLKERRWKIIGDHSWGESLNNRATLKRIYNCLDDDGIFEIWFVSKDLIAKAYDVGFKVFEEIPEKQLVVLKKG